jgi:hypothetical protein
MNFSTFNEALSNEFDFNNTLCDEDKVNLIKNGTGVIGHNLTYVDALKLTNKTQTIQLESLPITKNIKIGDCMNCIHRIENSEYGDMCGHESLSKFNSVTTDCPDLEFNDNFEYTPPTTGCPQQEQTYIFHFVK